jgi:diadenosine tetraphosphate (Ap4A) HIT family hydrolase
LPRTSEQGAIGTLFLESKRHVLDFSEFDDAEVASFGGLMRKIYTALWSLADTERVYQVSMMEGVAHFHAWILPRTKEVTERGIAFLARDLTCTDEEAAELATKLREVSRQW